MDPRFDTSKDPRFKKVPRSVRRIKVDKRFAHMFDDKNFVETPSVDSRGQRLRKDSVKNKLREFYELAADEGVSAEPNQRHRDAEASDERGDHVSVPRKGARKEKKSSLQSKRVAEQGRPDSEDADDDVDAEDEAAGEDSSGESQGDSSHSEAEEEAELDENSSIWKAEEDVPTGDATSRLALMGCDWDHTSAGDLLVMLRTYLSSKECQKAGGLRTGTVERVAVYPSQFGKEQLEKESQSGPSALAESRVDEEESEAKVNEAMRKYQLQRTKYYYAVAFCDSVATAACLYDQMDGIDAEGVCPAMLDMRFVPEDLEFPFAPREEATKTPSRYQGPAAGKSALGHTKVHCSWDEAPAHRKRDLMRKKFSPQELEQMDLDAYLASTSGEDDAASGAEELKKLVRGGGDSDDDFFTDGDDDGGKSVEGDMEATFSVSASKLEDDLAERVRQKQETDGSGRVHKLDDAKPKTTWQAYLEKRKEKRKERKSKAKAERDKRKNTGEEEPANEEATAGNDAADLGDLGLLAMGEGEDDDRGFNVRGRQRTAAKRAAKEGAADQGSGNYQVDVNDPRIARVFASGDFDIDPTNPEFRPSAGMQAVLKKKRERKLKVTKKSDPDADKPVADPEVRASSSSHSLRPERAAGAVGGGLQLFARKTDALGATQPVEGVALEKDGTSSKKKKRPHDGASQDAPPTMVDGQSRKKKRRKSAV